jgi:hypothetical protein
MFQHGWPFRNAARTAPGRVGDPDDQRLGSPFFPVRTKAMREIKIFHIPASEERIGDMTIHRGDQWRVEDVDCDG